MVSLSGFVLDSRHRRRNVRSPAATRRRCGRLGQKAVLPAPVADAVSTNAARRRDIENSLREGDAVGNFCIFVKRNLSGEENDGKGNVVAGGESECGEERRASGRVIEIIRSGR